MTHDELPSYMIDIESKINKDIVNSMPFMMKEAIKEDRYLMAKKIESNFLSGHIKGENDCSCIPNSDPCYYCGAKDYTLIAISILMDLK